LLQISETMSHHFFAYEVTFVLVNVLVKAVQINFILKVDPEVGFLGTTSFTTECVGILSTNKI
jgi:hypothetical protein